jgi:hypothetical protein
MLLPPLFYRYYCTSESHTCPRSNQVSYVQGALLTGKCSGLGGLLVGVHYVCIPQGGSQQDVHVIESVKRGGGSYT